MDRKCQHVDADGARCDSGAMWGVQLWVPCPSPGEPTRWIGLKLSMEVCSAHQDAVRPYVVGNKEMITTKLMDEGLPEPDFLNLRIEFPPVEGRNVEVLAVCDREGCKKRARWRVVLKSIAGHPWGALTNLSVCTRHKATTTAADVPLDAEQLREWLTGRGLRPSDIQRVELEFSPLVAKLPAGFLRS